MGVIKFHVKPYHEACKVVTIVLDLEPVSISEIQIFYFASVYINVKDLMRVRYNMLIGLDLVYKYELFKLLLGTGHFNSILILQPEVVLFLLVNFVINSSKMNPRLVRKDVAPGLQKSIPRIQD